jgi:murein DD-endopeptidase MepM/ murein hydrolase activator NlpD
VEFGVAASSPAHAAPVVTRLDVPAAAVAGPPPRVSLRIDERGVRRGNVTVSVVANAPRRAVLVDHLGWIATGRRRAVAWPRGATLPPGSYHVRVVAHDPRGRHLLRLAHASGVSDLEVAAPAPREGAAQAPAPEAGVPTPAQTVADGAVFPVAGPHNFGGPENRFGAPRGDHIHEGQDILTAEGTAVLAPLAGTVTSTSYQPGGAGYYLVEHTAVGFDFMFAHCQAGSVAVAADQAVAAGQMVCRAGQTGDATAPHLHFEMWVGGWQSASGHAIDPLPYLQAWDREGPTG